MPRYGGEHVFSMRAMGADDSFVCTGPSYSVRRRLLRALRLADHHHVYYWPDFLPKFTILRRRIRHPTTPHG